MDERFPNEAIDLSCLASSSAFLLSRTISVILVSAMPRQRHQRLVPVFLSVIREIIPLLLVLLDGLRVGRQRVSREVWDHFSFQKPQSATV